MPIAVRVRALPLASSTARGAISPSHSSGVIAMALKKGVDVKPASGKLGILLPGMGAVATTFIAGVQAIRKGLGKPIGSLTQLGHIRIGKRTDGNSPAIKDYVSIAKLDDIVFGGWDIFPDNAYQAAMRAGVLDEHKH